MIGEAAASLFFMEQKTRFRHREAGSAESQGFEPWVRYHPTHDFQSCALDHSANSPGSECSLETV